MIFGSRGVLGTTLQLDLQNQHLEVVPVTRSDLDIHNYQALKNFLTEMGEATIVNCIAYMPADKCELEPEISRAINLDFVEKLADVIASSSNQKLVQFSSDFIFDGQSKNPYKIDSPPNPINTYGIHKYAAETIVLEKLSERAKIIRFASLISYSSQRKTFLEKVIDRTMTNGEASIVSDLKVSTATSELISKVVTSISTMETSIIHAVHSGETSWYAIAKCAFDAIGLDVKINQINSELSPTAAARPKYSVLEPSPEVLELDSRHWHSALSEYAFKHLRTNES